MKLEDDLKTTIIKAHTLSKKPEVPETDYQIRKADREDFNYFKSSDKYSKRDIQILQNADVCVVVRDGDSIVHHNCIALESFQHPTIPLEIDLEDTEACSYNSWTAKSHRGQGIFQDAIAWRARYVYDQGIRCIYGHIGEQNKASLKATRKAGWEKSGEIHTVDAGEFEIHMITGKSIYADTVELTTQIGDIELAKTRDNRFSRIARELEEYIDQWSESDDEVVLFGSGNHAQKIIDRTDLESLVSYAVDEDSSKTGSNVPNSDIPVRSIDELSKNDPNVVIICSEAFQSDMAARARAKSETANIIVLYPHVSRFEERD